MDWPYLTKVFRGSLLVLVLVVPLLYNTGIPQQQHGVATPFHCSAPPFHGSVLTFHGSVPPLHGTSSASPIQECLFWATTLL
jgi:hypothetical protein